jgi:glutathione synthase/RimK-type ligase-like ATP-grasp enzyme
MKPRLLILTPDPDTPSINGRWGDVLAAYKAALKDTDMQVSDAPWSAMSLPQADLVTPLVAWGYHNRPDAFVRAISGMAVNRAVLANPAALIRWNVDKAYLKDIAEAGLPTVPTLYAEQLSKAIMHQARADFGSEALVLKPRISAGAKQTLIWRGAELPTDDPEARLDDEGCHVTAPHENLMVQPFLPAIKTEGEWSLIFFGGVFSHAILKTPKPGDFRSQPDYQAHLRALDPPEDVMKAASDIIDWIGPQTLTYGRVDLVRGLDNRPSLMEIELIEPDLYLGYAEGAKLRFAAALKQRIAQAG